MEREVDKGNPVTRAAGQVYDAAVPDAPKLGGGGGGDMAELTGEGAGGEEGLVALAALSRKPLSPDEVRKKAMRAYLNKGKK